MTLQASKIAAFKKVPSFWYQIHKCVVTTVRLGKTKWGTLQRFVRIKIKGQALKTFRYDIKLDELYVVPW